MGHSREGEGLAITYKKATHLQAVGINIPPTISHQYPKLSTTLTTLITITARTIPSTIARAATQTISPVNPSLECQSLYQERSQERSQENLSNPPHTRKAPQLDFYFINFSITLKG